jgi:hypothetical protein
MRKRPPSYDFLVKIAGICLGAGFYGISLAIWMYLSVNINRISAPQLMILLVSEYLFITISGLFLYIFTKE